jgi:uncharacterized membrane protein
MGDFGRVACGVVAALLAVALAGSAAAQDGIRMIEGSLTYRERIALPPDALAVVEMRDARGRLLGEATLGTRGAQVPVPFRIGLPAGVDASLRAALVVGGRPQWYVSEIAIPAGTDPVSLGEVVLLRYVPMGFASTLRCGGRELAVGFFEANAVLEVGGRRTVLEPVPAASGARFEAPGDPGTWVWSRGNAVLVSIAGEAMPECSVVPPAPPRPYRAQGNEPGWVLTVANGRMTLLADYSARTVEAALPEARFEEGAFVYEVAEPPLTVRMAPRLCRDDMTGMPYPETVTVTLEGRDLAGCGGDPLDLLTGAEWVVEDIGRRGIIDSSRVTLTFGADGALGGTASCNRYATSMTIGGEGVSVLAGAFGRGLELAAGGHDVLAARGADRAGVAGLVDDVGEGLDPRPVGALVGRAGPFVEGDQVDLGRDAGDQLHQPARVGVAVVHALQHHVFEGDPLGVRQPRILAQRVEQRGDVPFLVDRHQPVAHLVGGGVEADRQQAADLGAVRAISGTTPEVESVMRRRERLIPSPSIAIFIASRTASKL